MIPHYNEDKAKWFYGKEEIPGQIQGLFYVPSLEQFCTEDGGLLPYTFMRPAEIFTPSDQPHTVVSLSPWDFPTVKTVASVHTLIMHRLSQEPLDVTYIEDKTGRDYFLIGNTALGTSEHFSVGQLARAIMVNGVATAMIGLRAELKQAGVVA